MSTKKVKKDKTTKTDPLEMLLNWKTLNDKVSELTEEEAMRLLDIERTGKRRLGFMMRLYGRFNTLRTIRERSELAGGSVS